MWYVPNYMVLLFFYNKGKYTASDLNRLTKLSQPSILTTNKKLLEDGIITINFLDKKSKIIELTEKGKILGDLITKIFNELNIKEEIFLFKYKTEESKNELAN